MDNPVKSPLLLEWKILHKDHEKYEQFSLCIKLFSVAICLAALALEIGFIVTALILLVLWLQDAIWKTFQFRMADRLILLEEALEKKDVDNLPTPEESKDDEDTTSKPIDTPKDEKALSIEAFQFYRQWALNRPDTSGLMDTYISNGLRPTVAYPYVALIIIAAFWGMLY